MNAHREQTLLTCARVSKTVGGLASGVQKSRNAGPRESVLALKFNGAPLLGKPAEIVTRLKRLQPGGIEGRNGCAASL